MRFGSSNHRLYLRKLSGEERILRKFGNEFLKLPARKIRVFLSQRRHYLYCMIIAALACTHTPLGTVLGIFTIFVLMRPSVKELFQAKGTMRLSPEPFDEYVTE